MIEKPDLVIFSGYARSGKSSIARPALENMGYTFVSTSEALHETLQLIAKDILNIELDTYDKETEFLEIESTTKKYKKELGIFRGKVVQWHSMRKLLIVLAEDILVKVFGREIFALYAAKIIKNNLASGRKCAFETIGGDEFSLVKDFLSEDIFEKAFQFNIRRDSEQEDADYRQLLPDGVDIDNNGDSQWFAINLLNEINHASNRNNL